MGGRSQPSSPDGYENAVGRCGPYGSSRKAWIWSCCSTPRLHDHQGFRPWRAASSILRLSPRPKSTGRVDLVIWSRSGST